MAKINISIDDKLLERIDNISSDIYMSRSGFIANACAHYIINYENDNAIRDISLCMRKIADSGNVDPEVLTHLQDLERICKVLHHVQ